MNIFEILSELPNDQLDEFGEWLATLVQEGQFLQPLGASALRQAIAGYLEANHPVRLAPQARITELNAWLWDRWRLNAVMRWRNARRDVMDAMANAQNTIWTFSENDIKHLPRFIEKLRSEPRDPVSEFLWTELETLEQDTVTRYQLLGPEAGSAQQVVVNVLNRIVQQERCIHGEDRFADIPLRKQTSEVLEDTRAHQPVAKLNRLLLEDAFPFEFYQKQNGWGVEAFYQPLVKVTQPQEFTERLTAQRPDDLSAYVLNRLPLKAQNALTARKHLRSLLQVGLTEIVAEDRRAVELGQNQSNMLTLNVLLRSYVGLVEENPHKMVVVVFFHEGKDYAVYAYHTDQFHRIAWFPRHVGPENHTYTMTFDPNRLDDAFKFRHIEDFMRRSQPPGEGAPDVP